MWKRELYFSYFESAMIIKVVIDESVDYFYVNSNLIFCKGSFNKFVYMQHFTISFNLILNTYILFTDAMLFSHQSCFIFNVNFLSRWNNEYPTLACSYKGKSFFSKKFSWCRGSSRLILYQNCSTYSIIIWCFRISWVTKVLTERYIP